MMKRLLMSMVVVTLVLLMTGTSVFAQTVPAGQPGNNPGNNPGENPIKHVVLIGWDGLGSAYVNWDEVPTLKKMKENGAWTTKTRCVLPSVSAINWASILMGAGSELHGYRNWGSEKPEIPSRVLTDKGRFPDIFSVVHTQMPGAVTASAYTWKTIGCLHENPDADHTKHIAAAEHTISPKEYQQLVDQFIAYQKDSPVLSFVYFDDPDTAGHQHGWGSDVYQKKLTELDGYVASILNYLEENGRLKDTLVIFVSDHGGTGKGHGHETLQDMETPWILYGAGVKQGEITDTVVNYDTAATIVWALQLQAPQCWRGKPVTAAFAF